jgi:hypothetical protein
MARVALGSRPRAICRPDDPERPVLLAVDQQLGEGTALRVAPELADPVGAVEVWEATRRNAPECPTASWTGRTFRSETARVTAAPPGPRKKVADGDSDEAGLTLGLALAVALLFVVAPAASAQGREQIVFSGEAEGTLGEVGFGSGVRSTKRVRTTIATVPCASTTRG